MGRVTASHPTELMSTTDLVSQAREGREAAWAELVHRYDGLVRSTVRRACQDEYRAADIVQNTWVRLFEHIDRVEAPEHLPLWLATTARREAWRLMSDARRAVPLATVPLEAASFDASAGDRSSVEDAVLGSDAHDWLERAANSLPPAWKPLIDQLIAADSPSYKEISQALSIPIGSIGPTRARCIRQLRHLTHPA